MRARNAALRVIGPAYAFFWVGGIATRCAHSTAPHWASPVFLLLAAACAALTGAGIRAVAIFACGGFLAELVGVQTGVPFGYYAYTPALGPALGGVPLAISCAWVALLTGARDLAWRVSTRRWIASLTGAALMIAADLLIDPVAARVLYFWRWLQPGSYFGVPAVNFAGWFAVSALLLALAGKPQERSLSAVWVGGSILAFFGLAFFA